MKIPRSFLTPAVIALSGISPLHAQTAQPNPLDFPGPPVGPNPGGPGGLPFIPPPVNPPATVTLNWTGGPVGNFFSAGTWKDSADQSQNFTVGTAINYLLVASNVQFNNPDNQINLGTGSLTLGQSLLNLHNPGTPAQGGIIGQSDTLPSLLALGSGSVITADYLRNLQIEEEAGTASNLFIHSTRSGHSGGTAFSGSTIDLSHGAFSLIYSDAGIANPVTFTEVMSSYLTQVTFGGATPVYGLDPLVAEPGDNFIMTPVTSSTDGGITQFTGGWTISAVPEPSTLLLGAAAAPLLLMRRRTLHSPAA